MNAEWLLIHNWQCRRDRWFTISDVKKNHLGIITDVRGTAACSYTLSHLPFPTYFVPQRFPTFPFPSCKHFPLKQSCLPSLRPFPAYFPTFPLSAISFPAFPLMFIGNALCCYSMYSCPSPLYLLQGSSPQKNPGLLDYLDSLGIPLPTSILIWLSYLLVT
jgi:hypothetical protein